MLAITHEEIKSNLYSIYMRKCQIFLLIFVFFPTQRQYLFFKVRFPLTHYFPALHCHFEEVSMLTAGCISKLDKLNLAMVNYDLRLASQNLLLSSKVVKSGTITRVNLCKEDMVFKNSINASENRMWQLGFKLVCPFEQAIVLCLFLLSLFPHIFIIYLKHFFLIQKEVES